MDDKLELNNIELKCDYHDFKTIFTPWYIQYKLKDNSTICANLNIMKNESSYDILLINSIYQFDYYVFNDNLINLKEHLIKYIPIVTNHIANILNKNRNDNVLSKLSQIPKILMESNDIEQDINNIINSCEQIDNMIELPSYIPTNKFTFQNFIEGKCLNGCLKNVFSYLTNFKDTLRASQVNSAWRKYIYSICPNKNNGVHQWIHNESFKLYMKMPISINDKIESGRAHKSERYEYLLKSVRDILLIGIPSEINAIHATNNFECKPIKYSNIKCGKCDNNMFSYSAKLSQGCRCCTYESDYINIDICINSECISNFSKTYISEEYKQIHVKNIICVKYVDALLNYLLFDDKDNKFVLIKRLRSYLVNHTNYNDIKLHEHINLKVNIPDMNYDDIIYSKLKLKYPLNEVITDYYYKFHIEQMENRFNKILECKFNNNSCSSFPKWIINYFDKHFNKEFLKNKKYYVNKLYPFWWDDKKKDNDKVRIEMNKWNNKYFNENLYDIEPLHDMPIKIIVHHFKNQLRFIATFMDGCISKPKKIPKFVYDIYEKIMPNDILNGDCNHYSTLQSMLFDDKYDFEEIYCNNINNEFTDYAEYPDYDYYNRWMNHPY